MMEEMVSSLSPVWSKMALVCTWCEFVEEAHIPWQVGILNTWTSVSLQNLGTSDFVKPSIIKL